MITNNRRNPTKEIGSEMKTEEIIVAIPHTGTRFLKERLGLPHVHTNNLWQTIMQRTKGKHIIAPLRDPIETWKSFVRRDETDVVRFVSAWYNMNTLATIREMEGRPIEFIPLEHQNHPRITDWTIVTNTMEGEINKNNENAPQLNLKNIYLLPFVQNHCTRPRETIV